MSIAPQVAYAIHRLRAVIRHRRTLRAMEALPPEVLKDIGWQLQQRRTSGPA